MKGKACEKPRFVLENSKCGTSGAYLQFYDLVKTVVNDDLF